MEKLTYKKVGDVVIDIDLHNDYIVRAIADYDKTSKRYKVHFYLKEYTIEKYTLINTLDQDHISFNGNYRTIRVDILKFIARLHSKNFFQKSIDNYKFENKCFDIGCEALESGQSVN